MIPLVLVERYESRLLLGIDVFINDKLLPRLKKNHEQLDPDTIDRAIAGAIKEYFPNPQDLIEPAQSFAEAAAQRLSTGFITEISKVQDVSSQVISSGRRSQTAGRSRSPRIFRFLFSAAADQVKS